MRAHDHRSLLKYGSHAVYELKLLYIVKTLFSQKLLFYKVFTRKLAHEQIQVYRTAPQIAFLSIPFKMKMISIHWRAASSGWGCQREQRMNPKPRVWIPPAEQMLSEKRIFRKLQIQSKCYCVYVTSQNKDQNPPIQHFTSPLNNPISAEIWVNALLSSAEWRSFEQRMQTLLLES